MRLTLKIAKGKHSPPIQDRFKLWWLTTVSGYYISDFRISGVREDLGKDQHDWNKLAGRGRLWPKWFGGFIAGHHWQSKRIAWRWYKKKFELSHYNYEKGVRKIKRASQPSANMFLKSLKSVNLFPYHGGNLKATRTITIMLELEKR